MSAETADTLEISLQVNRAPVRRRVAARQHLADFLREELGLTGTHVGCEHGVCGACTVRVDGEIVRSCLVLAVQADGARVETIEGLSAAGTVGALQRAFHERNAIHRRVLAACERTAPPGGTRPVRRRPAVAATRARGDDAQPPCTCAHREYRRGRGVQCARRAGRADGRGCGAVVPPVRRRTAAHQGHAVGAAVAACDRSRALAGRTGGGGRCGKPRAGGGCRPTRRDRVGRVAAGDRCRDCARSGRSGDPSRIRRQPVFRAGGRYRRRRCRLRARRPRGRSDVRHLTPCRNAARNTGHRCRLQSRGKTPHRVAVDAGAVHDAVDSGAPFRPAGNQRAGNRPGRRRRLRAQDPRVRRRDGRGGGVLGAGAAGEIHRGPPRIVRVRQSRARPPREIADGGVARRGHPRGRHG
ncbi:MAG: 2Fe-2S iron-sulfur cluster binding domain-containing protein [Betaproteobacteria bacterium]|nr:2Fe-2S iron-sulfur cluster binding domain-containing protein [Betaproteobacteria bacterium]